MDSMKWLKLACKKGTGKDTELGDVLGNAATDNHRIHRDNSLPPGEWGTKFNYVFPRKTNSATVSRVDLIDACKRALSIRSKGWRPDLRMSMGESLTYSAHNPETGTINGEIVDGQRVTVKWTKRGEVVRKMSYIHHNPEKVVEFAINAKYLSDALSGMEGETVEINMGGPLHPFHITDGTREAVIMPIKTF